MKNKTSTKILIAFIFLIIFIFVRIIINYDLQGKILDNTNQITKVENVLDRMSEQVIGYDAILTAQVQAALLHAENKSEKIDIKEHKKKYDEISTKLDDIIKKDARILVVQSIRSKEAKMKVDRYLKNIDENNTKLVDLETRAFEAIENNDLKLARSLIIGGDYDKYKDNIYENYTEWSDLEYEITQGIQDQILKSSEHLIYINLIISIITIIIAIVTLIILRSFVVSTANRSQR